MKRNIEKMFYEGPIDDTILPKLEQEIVSGYHIRDWSEFDSLHVTPRPVHYYTLIIIMVLVQVGFYVFSMKNNYGKGETFFS